MGIESLKEKYMDAEKLEQVHKAILDNKTDELKNLVDEICSDMSSGNRNEVVQDLFLFASKNRSFDSMKWMAEDSGWDIDVNYKDSHGRTALHYIAMDMIDFREMESTEEAKLQREMILETARWLVEKGADVNAFDDTGFTALHYAANNGSRKLVQFFLRECQMDYSIRDPRKDDGKTPLEVVPQEFVKIIRIFQNKEREQREAVEAKEKEREFYGQAWNYIKEQKLDINWVFCKYCKSPYSPGLSSFLQKRYVGLSFIKRMYSTFNIDLSYKDEYGHSAFANAILSGELETVKWLVEECSVNPLDFSEDGKNALLLASEQTYHIDMIKYLVGDCNIDINSRDEEGNTPLINVINGYGRGRDGFEIIKYLVDHGADVNAKNNEGHSALWFMAWDELHSEETISFIINAGADCAVFKESLQRLALFGRLSIIKSLIRDHGVDPNCHKLCYFELAGMNFENKPGGCRVCVVEITKDFNGKPRRNLAPACATDCVEGTTSQWYICPSLSGS